MRHSAGRPQNRSRIRAVQEQGLAVLAQATGGDLYRMISNSDSAFQRLAAELSGYYLLGFEPDARDRNGRPHAISVGVRRGGVTVRSRRQFTIPTTTVKTAETEPIATLRDPLPAVEIPIKLTTYSFSFAILGTKGCASFSPPRSIALSTPKAISPWAT